MSEVITGQCDQCERRGLLYKFSDELICYLCRYRAEKSYDYDTSNLDDEFEAYLESV